jgi:hypothetical protein
MVGIPPEAQAELEAANRRGGVKDLMASPARLSAIA